MKKLLFISTICLSLWACKKTRTCDCKIITSGTTTTLAQVEAAGIDTSIVTPLSTIEQRQTELRKVSKKQAKYNCLDKSESINETTNNGVPGFLSISVTNKGTRNYDCELK
jgi:hypothetical protein